MEINTENNAEENKKIIFELGLDEISPAVIVLLNKVILLIYKSKLNDAKSPFDELLVFIEKERRNGKCNVKDNPSIKHFFQLLNDVLSRRLNPEALKYIELKGSKINAFHLTEIISLMHEKVHKKIEEELLEKELRLKKEILEKELKLKEEKEKEEKLVIEIKRVLNTTEDGKRINWDLNSNQISKEIGNQISSKFLDKVKTDLAIEWLINLGLRRPTEEQIKFIIDSQSSIRMTARAGSGKTEMVATKIIFLIYYLGHSHEEFLALTFNVSARKDLINRVLKIEEQAGFENSFFYPIMNFDRLSVSLCNKEQKPAKEKEHKFIIKKIVSHFLNTENPYSHKIQNLLLKSFRSDWEKWIHASEKYNKKQLEDLRSKLQDQTINGIVVKSRGEKRIGDFLFEHDIEFKYERPFRFKSKKIYPDFFLPQQELIIEYYGLLGNKEYEDEILYKYDFYSKSKYHLLELKTDDFQDFGTDFLEGREADYLMLSNKLSNFCELNNIVLEIKRLSDEEIIEKIKRNLELTFEDLVEQAVNRLNKISNDDEEIKDFIFNYTPITEEEKDFIDLLPVIFEKYKNYLREQELTNFSEIMWKCISKIDSGQTTFDTDKGRIKVDLKKIKYLFIDEFQDFSYLYQKLTKTIMKVSGHLLINAVGDDWQMIYRFMGSDLIYFNNFSEYFYNPKELSLTENFRSARKIVDFCNSIMIDRGIKARHSHLNRFLKGEIININLDEFKLVESERFFFNSDPIVSSLLRVIPYLKKRLNFDFRFKQEIEKRVERKIKFSYVLSRINKIPLKIEGANFPFIKNKLNFGITLLEEFLAKIYKEDLYEFSVQASTAHRSKGGEADTVVILSPGDFGKIHPSSQFMRIFGDHPEVLIEDERKLFYVACSRAKEQIIFLSNNQTNISEFIPNEEFISNECWDNLPYQRKIAPNLFSIEIRDIPKQKPYLYEKRKELENLGFKLVYENERPIRRKVINTNIKEASKEIVSTIETLNSCELYFVLLDSVSKKIFDWPGIVSKEDFLDSILNK